MSILFCTLRKEAAPQRAHCANRSLGFLLTFFICISFVLGSRVSVAQQTEKSPSLGLQIIQRDRLVPLIQNRNEGILSVSLRNETFTIVVRRPKDWIARSQGLPGSPPTDGLQIRLSTAQSIYEQLVIGERCSYLSFFGSARTIMAGEKPVTNLYVDDESLNFFDDDRFKTADSTSASILVKSILVENVIEDPWSSSKPDKIDILRSGKAAEIHAVFYLDLNGDNVVDRNEVDKISFFFTGH